MTSKINAITTGAGGIEVTGDSSGEIEFQADGSTIATITASGLDVASGLTFGSPIDIASGGTGQTTATASFNALAPSQAGNSGKYLTTDGTNTSWGTVDALPDQTSQSGKYLTTDGTNASWGTVSLPTVNDATLTLSTSGTGLSGSATFTANDADNATFTVTSNATNANTPSTIVARDASGNFSAGTITAALTGNVTGDVSGNAGTATKWATGRTITLSGDVTGTSASFDGSGNASITATVVDDSHNHIISNVDGLQTALDGKQPLDADLTAIGALAKTDGNFIVGNGSTWVAESGATARTSLGLGTLATLNSVNAATITDNSVGAAELNVSGNGTTSQFLRSDGDGTFTWATPSVSGTVVQVVQSYSSSAQALGANAWRDITGLNLTITPQSTANKILLLISFNGTASDNSANTFRLLRSGTQIYGSAGTNGGFRTWGNAAYARPGIFGANFNIYDSPNTTSARNYKVQGYANQTFYINRNYGAEALAGYYGTVSMIAIEIKG